MASQDVPGSTLSDLTETPSANEGLRSEDGNVSSDAVAATTQQLLFQHQSLVLRGLSAFLSASSLQTAFMSIADELQLRFDCDRVLLGQSNSRGVWIRTISQQSRVERRAADTALIENAMREAVLHEKAILCDGTEHTDAFPAHRLLHGGRPKLQYLSIPLFNQNESTGVLMLERTSVVSWAESTLVSLHCLTEMLAPLIVLREETERPLARRLAGLGKRALSTSVGRYQVRTKVAIIGLLALVILSAHVQVNHHIVAEATITPIERRLVTAPFTGYVSDIAVAAGDQVLRDQLLLQLDPRDLTLQRNQWQTDLEGAIAELRLAMAQHDRPQMAILRARRGRAAAEVERIDAQLARATIASPVNGVVVSNSLEDLMGRPVERGEILLEMASSEGYEIDLLINETDMAYVQAERRGHLSLAAIPDEKLAFTLSDVHPIAIAANGQTRFRVEANLNDAPARLLPGQTGIGRIQVGQASLLWIYTRSFRDWLHGVFWEWFG